ncbi:MAG: hypothetical protein AAF235_05065 [Planctomycetota bacterium]
MPLPANTPSPVNKLAMALSLSTMLATTQLAAAQIATIDFDRDADGQSLSTGVGFTGLEYERLGVRITSTSPRNSAMNLFNSSGPGFTGNDDDLITGDAFGSPDQGNVLILQNPGSKISNPNDDPRGGSFLFTFDNPAGVSLRSIGILDLDEDVTPGFTLTRADGSSFTNDTAVSGVELLNPSFPDDNSLRVYSFAGTDPITSLQIRLPRVSGAVAFVEFDRLVIPSPSAASLAALAGIAACRRRRARTLSRSV